MESFDQFQLAGLIASAGVDVCESGVAKATSHLESRIKRTELGKVQPERACAFSLEMGIRQRCKLPI